MFQISIAVMLVIGAGLVDQEFLDVAASRSGISSEGVLSAGLTLPVSKYSEPEQINNFHKQLLERISAIPGVKTPPSLTIIRCSRIGSIRFEIEGTGFAG